MEYLHRVGDRLHGEGVATSEEQLFHGNPAAAIVDLAHETPDSVVAMTTHGRSGIGRWVLGSVADKVARHSGQPVLLAEFTGIQIFGSSDALDSCEFSYGAFHISTAVPTGCRRCCYLPPQ